MTRNYAYFTIVFTLTPRQILSLKIPDLIGFFKIKSKHPDGLKRTRSGWKKPAMGALLPDKKQRKMIGILMQVSIR